MDFSTISDEALFGRVEALAQTERFSLADFLLHLGELDVRPACQRKGYSSVFGYLTRHLGYSESDAIRRVRAARAARQFPSVLVMLACGELHLVGIAMLQPVLTTENHTNLLRQACRRSQREIERLVANLAPACAIPRDRIRALPRAPNSAPKAGSSEPYPEPEQPLLQAENNSGEPPSLYPAIQTPIQTPVAETPRRVVFTFATDEQVRGLYEEARDLLRHRFPEGKIEQIIGEALRRLVEDERPGRRPGGRTRATPDAESRRVPRYVEDQVWRRDGGRCAYIGPEGLRCGETGWLELDHIVPWALGGRSDDPSNIRILCRAHNMAEARRVFGEEICGGAAPPAADLLK